MFIQKNDFGHNTTWKKGLDIQDLRLSWHMIEIDKHWQNHNN